MEPRARRLEPADEMGRLPPQVTDPGRDRPPGFRAPQTNGSHAAQGEAHGSRDVPARGSPQPPPRRHSAPMGRLEALLRGGDSPSSPRQLRVPGTVLGPCWRMRHCRPRRLSSPPEAGRGGGSRTSSSVSKNVRMAAAPTAGTEHVLCVHALHTSHDSLS